MNALSVAPGGGDTVARSLVRALAEIGQRDEYVVLVKDSLLADSEQWPMNVRFVVASVLATHGTARVAWEQTALRRLLRREHCDVLFGLAGYGLVSGSRPQVVMARNAYFYERRPWMRQRTRVRTSALRRLQLGSIAAGAYVSCVSGYMRDLVVECIGAESGRVFIIPHGTDMHLDLPDGAASADRGGSGVPRVFWLGNSGSNKRLEDLLVALPRVERSLGRPVHLRVAGRFTRHEVEDYESQARTAHLSRSPQFLGYLGRDAMRLEYSRATLYVSTSLLESYDNGVVEAMAMGVPVVASDIPVRGLARNHMRTYFPGDVDDLAAQITSVLLSDNERRRMSKGGAAYASHLTWHRAALKYRDLFCTSLQSQRSTR